MRTRVRVRVKVKGKASGTIRVGATVRDAKIPLEQFETQSSSSRPQSKPDPHLGKRIPRDN